LNLESWLAVMEQPLPPDRSQAAKG